MRVATIDVGTNSILLLIAEADPGDPVTADVRVLADRCRIERLGRGVDRTGALDEAAIARALDAIADYAGQIRSLGVTRVAAVGTQALREAKNGDRFLLPAQRMLGVPVEVIAGQREAGLSFLAVARSFPELARGELLVFDVGGGSTEFIFGQAGTVTRAVSLPIGAVRLTERHLHGDPPRPDEVGALVEALDVALGAAPIGRAIPIVGTAGTVTTLAAVALGLEPYDPARVHGTRLARTDVDRQLALYLGLPLERRRRLRGLEPARADVIGAGAAIVARVLERAAAPELTVSDRGVRWGLLYESLGQQA